MPASESDPTEFLRRLGESGDGPHDIARAALMLAALDREPRSLAPYETHLDKIAEAGRNDLRFVFRAEEAARLLSTVLAGRFGYDGDRLAYDDPMNADLISVIDRRRGLPVALGILYIHAARAAGFEACGLNTPAHFLLRIDVKGSNALIDPFNGGAAVDRERLGGPPGMSAAMPGESALSLRVSDSDVLLRLQNNIRLRALKAGDRERGLEIARRMVLVAPGRPDLWMELARLHEAGGSLGAAKRAYEACLALVKPGDGLHNEAVVRLSGLKRRIN
jgi:regulator of sirC expression with transglutaminase-like and TPR domain